MLAARESIALGAARPGGAGARPRRRPRRRRHRVHRIASRVGPGPRRIRLARATAALGGGDIDTVSRYLNSDPDIANTREKETTLSDLWFGWHEQMLSRQRRVEIDRALRQEVRRNFPPPLRFDFRLRYRSTDRSAARRERRRPKNH
jgi:hypothetical protein